VGTGSGMRAKRRKTPEMAGWESKMKLLENCWLAEKKNETGFFCILVRRSWSTEGEGKKMETQKPVPKPAGDWGNDIKP